jgi:hypothetical protein
MEYSKFNLTVTPTDSAAELGFETWINNHCVFNSNYVSETLTITGYLPGDDVEAEHTLKFVLKGKTHAHTKINNAGDIVQDACLKISNLTFDGIELGQLVNELTVYEHNFNGTGELTKHKFFGTMGCNGTVELKFTTPIYLWFLENM